MVSRVKPTNAKTRNACYSQGPHLKRLRPFLRTFLSRNLDLAGSGRAVKVSKNTRTLRGRVDTPSLRLRASRSFSHPLRLGPDANPT